MTPKRPLPHYLSPLHMKIKNTNGFCFVKLYIEKTKTSLLQERRTARRFLCTVLCSRFTGILHKGGRGAKYLPNLQRARKKQSKIYRMERLTLQCFKAVWRSIKLFGVSSGSCYSRAGAKIECLTLRHSAYTFMTSSSWPTHSLGHQCPRQNIIFRLTAFIFYFRQFHAKYLGSFLGHVCPTAV